MSLAIASARRQWCARSGTCSESQMDTVTAEQDASAAPPRVSVVMANYNGAAHIAAAVRSVLRQTETSLELIVSDDGSTDESLAIARAAAEGDPRLVIVRGAGRSGPAAARNRALSVARGAWVVIVDNDDYIARDRVERLVAAAERDKADIAADDLITFYEDGARLPHGHLRGAFAREPRWVEASAYERSNRMLGAGPALGYLKPIFRRTLPLCYDESLRIAEDSDLVLRLLIGGARMRIYPTPGYFYRKHAASISHRLDTAAIEALDHAYAALAPCADPALDQALARGAAARADALAFTNLIAALKARDWTRVINVAAKRPGALALLRAPLLARLARPFARRQRVQTRPRVTLLSRQRIVGAANGSSAYVLALSNALTDAGYDVDYVGVSQHIFGRWAMLRLRTEMSVFHRVLIKNGLRVGNVILARDPRLWLASALAILDAALRRMGFKAHLSAPAVYDKSAPVTRDEALFVARAVAPNPMAVLCDYAFLAPYAPYALAPDAPSLVIMHDLLSGRVTDASEQQVTELPPDAEFRLLSMADAVIAIQHDEASKVAAALPNRTVLTAPHAVPTAPRPQPGEPDRLLFVGSNTAPNIIGLQWFFKDVWPAVRAARPNACLQVAGSVARAIHQAPEGVNFLGVVQNLAPLYAQAGIVISPLLTGSGLKIKLVEALAAGKAVVGTSITTQGVEAQTVNAMAVADDPSSFAQAVINLSSNDREREDLAKRALACAEGHFSPKACFRSLVNFVAAASASAPEKRLPAPPSTAQ